MDVVDRATTVAIVLRLLTNDNQPLHVSSAADDGPARRAA